MSTRSVFGEAVLTGAVLPDAAVLTGPGCRRLGSRTALPTISLDLNRGDNLIQAGAPAKPCDELEREAGCQRVVQLYLKSYGAHTWMN